MFISVFIYDCFKSDDTVQNDWFMNMEMTVGLGAVHYYSVKGIVRNKSNCVDYPEQIILPVGDHCR